MGAPTDTNFRKIFFGPGGESATTSSRALATASAYFYGFCGYASTNGDTVKIYDDATTAAGALLAILKAQATLSPLIFSPAYPIRAENGIYVQVSAGVPLVAFAKEGNVIR